MSLTNLKINNIPGREFILSPTVKNGRDRECSPKDFLQYSKKIIYLGCLGSAMQMKHRKTGIIYSMVGFEKEKIFKLNYQEKINSTLDLMYKATHPYMFRLLNNYETETHLGLIFESFEGDSLDILIQKGKCDIQTSLKYLVEVILAIIHMNDLGLYNLNIRPEYILVDECIYLTDYNLKMKDKPDMPKRAKDILNINNQNNVLIDIYYSPEEINSIKNGKLLTNLNSKLDSWKCGMLLFEMLTKFKWPFINNKNVDINMIDLDNKVCDAILNSEVDLSLISDSFCRNLISKLLKKNPEERIDIKDIINIDIIKSINIEQKEININDNIINPIDEEDKEENEKDEIDKDDKDILIKQLKSENELLKKKLSQEKSEGNNTHFIDKIRPLILGNTNSNIKEKEKDTSIENNVKNKNTQEITENKINTNLEQKINNENFSEKDIENKSSSNDNNIDIVDSNNNENILAKYKKLKEKYKLKEQEIKNLKDELSKIKKEKQISEQKSLNDLEKINISKITNISELSNFVFNSLKIFGESQKNMENLVQKLINISGKEHNSLMEESKKYIEKKTKIFFETLDKIIAEGKKNEIKENNEEEIKKNNIIKENEFYEMKKNYELIKQNEEKLKEKIKILEEKNNALESRNKNLMRTIDDMYVHYKGDDTTKK